MKGRRLIALTGAESSGKTTLAVALARELAAPLVTEAARDMLTPGKPYTVGDVISIAQEQFRRESEAFESADHFVIADTDLLVIRIWLDERFHIWPEVLEQLWRRSAPRLRVLTSPDMPWAPDPMRENPLDRMRLHQRYRDALATLGEPWLEVQGLRDERVSHVLSRVHASRH